MKWRKSYLSIFRNESIRRQDACAMCCVRTSARPNLIFGRWAPYSVLGVLCTSVLLVPVPGTLYILIHRRSYKITVLKSKNVGRLVVCIKRHISCEPINPRYNKQAGYLVVANPSERITFPSFHIHLSPIRIARIAPLRYSCWENNSCCPRSQQKLYSSIKRVVIPP